MSACLRYWETRIYWDGFTIVKFMKEDIINKCQHQTYPVWGFNTTKQLFHLICSLYWLHSLFPTNLSGSWDIKAALFTFVFCLLIIVVSEIITTFRTFKLTGNARKWAAIILWALQHTWSFLSLCITLKPAQVWDFTGAVSRKRAENKPEFGFTFQETNKCLWFWLILKFYKF